MDRFEEIKKEWQKAKDEGCNAFTLWEKDMDLIMSEIERLRKAMEFIQQWAVFDNIDSITDAENILSKIQSRAYQALKEGE